MNTAKASVKKGTFVIESINHRTKRYVLGDYTTRSGCHAYGHPVPYGLNQMVAVGECEPSWFTNSVNQISTKHLPTAVV